MTKLSATFSFLLSSILVAGLSALGLCLLVAIRLPAIQLFDYVSWGGFPAALLAVLLCSIVVAIMAAATYLARREHALPTAAFLWSVVAAYITTRLALIACVSPPWGGDFQRYWEAAVQMAETGDMSAGTSLYKQRAALVMYPLVTLFGESHLAMKAANAGALLAVLLLGYDILRIVRNHQAAQAFAVLFLFCPMPAFDGLIPSHNVWGLLFLAFVVWCVTRACYARGEEKSRTIVIVFALLAAIGLELLDIQRGAGVLILIALMACAFLVTFSVGGQDEPSREWRFVPLATWVVALTIAVAIVPLGKLTTHAGVRLAFTPDTKTMVAMKFAAHGGVFGDGRSSSWARFDQRFKEKHKQGEAQAADFARSLILTSWADPDGNKLRLIRALTPRLFDLGYPADWDVTLKSPKRLSPLARNALVAYANVFGFFCAVAGVMIILWSCLSGVRPPLPVLAVLVFTGLLAALLLTLFENKSPNLYSTWLAIPLLLAWAASRIRRGSKPIAPRIALAQLATGWGLVAAVLWAGLGILDQAYGYDDGRVIDGWDEQWQPSADPARPADIDQTVHAFDGKYYPENSIKSWVRRDAADDSRRLTKYADDFYAVLELPLPISKGDRATLSRKICANGDRTSLEFFLFAAYQRKDKPRSFVLEVASDSGMLKRIPIPLSRKNIRLYRIDDVLGGSGCKTLRFSLLSNIRSNKPSWQQASHVEIWIPRLIPE